MDDCHFNPQVEARFTDFMVCAILSLTRYPASWVLLSRRSYFSPHFPCRYCVTVFVPKTFTFLVILWALDWKLVAAALPIGMAKPKDCTNLNYDA